MKVLTDLKTTIFGFIGGSTVTTALAALADDRVLDTLAQYGVSPLTLILIGGIAKVLRDYFAKDKEGKNAQVQTSTTTLTS